MGSVLVELARQVVVFLVVALVDPWVVVGAALKQLHQRRGAVVAQLQRHLSRLEFGLRHRHLCAQSDVKSIRFTP